MRSPLADRGGLWAHGDFLRLWSAQTISQVGTQITLLALPLAAIIVLDASPLEVALIGTFEVLPFLLFALPAGVLIDRLPRRPILVVTDVGRALVLASIPAAYWLDVLTLPQLYAVGFLVGLMTVFFDVAYLAYLPSLVDRIQLVDANGKLETTRFGHAGRRARAGGGPRRRGGRAGGDPARLLQLRRRLGPALAYPPAGKTGRGESTLDDRNLDGAQGGPLIRVPAVVPASADASRWCST